jgi:hypothetical protein
MPAPQERPWFQFHLSTAVVLMFVAAGLLWLNVAGESHPGGSSGEWTELGWPRGISRYDHYQDGTLDNSVWMPSAGNGWGGSILPAITANCAAALTILVLIAVCAEWLIRRKQHRKAEAGQKP